MLSQGLTGEATRLIHREDFPLRTKGTRKILSSLRPRGPETPCPAPIPKVEGSNPGRETKGHEAKRKNLKRSYLPNYLSYEVDRHLVGKLSVWSR